MESTCMRNCPHHHEKGAKFFFCMYLNKKLENTCWWEGDKWLVSIFLTEPLQSQRRNTRRNSWRHSSWETNCVRKRRSNCRNFWSEWVSCAELTEVTPPENPCNLSPTWFILRGFVSTLPDRITKYYNPPPPRFSSIQASWPQTVVRETPSQNQQPFMKFVFVPQTLARWVSPMEKKIMNHMNTWSGVYLN